MLDPKRSVDSVAATYDLACRLSGIRSGVRLALLCGVAAVLACSGANSETIAASTGGGVGVGGNVPGTVGTSTGGSSQGGRSGAATSRAEGGLVAGGGSPGAGGGAATAGVSSYGGFASLGGTRATAGQANTAGVAFATGGALNDGGARATGGYSPVGGVSLLGGATAAGGKASGGEATGGIQRTGGFSAAGGSKSTAAGGATTSGGSSSTGATTAVGGTGFGGSGNAGASSMDRCDVGIYDPANPPRVHSLGGNLGAHDPSLIFQESNGTYYEYQTGLGAKTSTNLATWSAAAAPFSAPAWIKTAVPGVTDLWAPDISYFNGQYHLYYSGSTFGKNRSCIGHATRTSLDAGTWTDQGQVICSNVDTADNWNAIDPNVVLDTNGAPWLSFGSFWSGIKLIQLDLSGARVGNAAPVALADRPRNGGALEGPFIVRRCGYYYLFTSWDTCCQGAESTYNIRVARSTSLTGPYTDKAGTQSLEGGGTLMTQGNGSTWAGPGGQSVMIVGTRAYLIYHAYSITDAGAATLRIADLVWDSSGWPVPVGP